MILHAILYIVKICTYIYIRLTSKAISLQKEN
jgi:hypothetical protein